uniref:Uncharacterized protein n=1 Tax=Rousettus aegyptiacus TaxID=9407 RepID=A0A7J8FI48_ROUAE|nr:hypothetical protein HJG63_011878 [Rousettus aegyptiacus]
MLLPSKPPSGGHNHPSLVPFSILQWVRVRWRERETAGLFIKGESGQPQTWPRGRESRGGSLPLRLEGLGRRGQHTGLRRPSSFRLPFLFRFSSSGRSDGERGSSRAKWQEQALRCFWKAIVRKSNHCVFCS